MRLVYIFAALLLVSCDASPPPTAANTSAAAPPVAAPANRITVAIPDAERKFMEALLEAVEPYKAAPNELKKSSIRKARDKKLRDVVRGGRFDGWYGYLQEMKTTSDGHAYITVAMPDQLLVLKTWNNSVSDAGDHTLIKNGSSLYEQISNIEQGKVVKVSGQFIKEGSLTEAGAVLDPEFIVRFSTIETVN